MVEPDPVLLQPVLERYASSGRTALLPSLHDTQNIYGYIPPFAVETIARNLSIPLADVFGVLTFYNHFRTEAQTGKHLFICKDPACVNAGAKEMAATLQKKQGRNFTLEQVPCLGLCDLAPGAMADRNYHKLISELATVGSTAILSRKHHTHIGGELSILTRNCGKGTATSLAQYRTSGGYIGLEKALKLAPAEVIAQVKASGLVGRGGAAFPTGVKWEGAASAQGNQRYIICNADEAEPGTFKDRVMLEDDPHHVLEGILIAAYATQASQGYIYIRAEYQEAFDILQAACEEARQAGILGENVLGSQFTFQLELRQGAGAYVCGEETALFESIEGKRGLPRIKPPFPTTHGLFGKPTVINNVETLSNIPEILREGAEVYISRGTAKSTGTKLFCLSGDIARPGLYELPFGASLRHLVMELAGGVRGGKPFQAALVGGAAGGFASPADLDVRLSFEDMRAAGVPLGAGVVMVFDDTRDLKTVLLRLAHFFAEESCGKCFPCQLGTQRQVEILERNAVCQSMAGDLQRLMDIGQAMTDTSLCGLGQTASTAILSALKRWPDLIQPAPAGGK